MTRCVVSRWALFCLFGSYSRGGSSVLRRLSAFLVSLASELFVATFLSSVMASDVRFVFASTVPKARERAGSFGVIARPP